MKRDVILIFNVFLIGVAIGILFMYFMICQNQTTENKAVFSPFSDTLSERNVLYVLNKINVQHSDIVLNQARLESGNFTSTLAKEKNNIFGLYDSNKLEYYTFDHWVESCIAYKNLVQSKYKGGDYYDFLENLPYALDADYIKKLKSL